MLLYELPGGCALRHLTERDAGELERVVAANRDYLARWLPWVEATAGAGIGARREYIRRARRQLAANDGFQAAIVEGEQIVGVIGFHHVDWANRSTSLGYWLAEDRQGRGTMTDAVRTLVRHAFEVWDLNRIEIRVAVGNTRSAAIPRRLGFVEEGVLRQAERHAGGFRDIVVFSLLRRDEPRV
jgi:ribosomal-protein-serine acetyltransferase